MARVNPWTLKRRPRVQDTRTFISAENLDQPLTLTLRASAETGDLLAPHEDAAEFVRTYVTGYKDEKGEWTPPTSLVPPEGEPVTFTRSFCKLIAELLRMQVPQEGDAPYTFEEMALILSGMSDVTPDIAEWKDELIARAAGELKNESTEAGSPTA